MKSTREKLYSMLHTITLEDYQKYLDEEKNGYIKINKHPEDENIVILNYTELTTFDKRWNNETMSARGLILDLTEAKYNDKIYVLAKPFEKFFNYGENLDYEKEIDFSNIVSVMEKMDGSLGISYFFNNEIRFATRGSFTSDQAIKATEIWKEKYSHVDSTWFYASAPVTYLVEIVYPENRVVVDYGDKEDLIMLGTIYLYGNQGFLDASYQDVKWEAERLGMPIAPQYTYSLEQMVELKEKIGANEEGWIIRFGDNKRLKIKGDEYMQVHRIKHGMSEKAKFRAWSEGSLREYIMMLPEEFRPELEEFESRLDNVKDMLHVMFTSMFSYMKSSFPERKDFALHVTSSAVAPEYRKFFFDAFKTGKISESLIREHIYKNYREYIEVIYLWNK